MVSAKVWKKLGRILILLEKLFLFLRQTNFRILSLKVHGAIKHMSIKQEISFAE